MPKASSPACAKPSSATSPAPYTRHSRRHRAGGTGPAQARADRPDQRAAVRVEDRDAAKGGRAGMALRRPRNPAPQNPETQGTRAKKLKAWRAATPRWVLRALTAERAGVRADGGFAAQPAACTCVCSVRARACARARARVWAPARTRPKSGAAAAQSASSIRRVHDSCHMYCPRPERYSPPRALPPRPARHSPCITSLPARRSRLCAATLRPSPLTRRMCCPPCVTTPAPLARPARRFTGTVSCIVVYMAAAQRFIGTASLYSAL